MARTADELQEEEEEEEEPQPESESEDEDAVPYNPKNLPLGWDGKVQWRMNTLGKGMVLGEEGEGLGE